MPNLLRFALILLTLAAPALAEPRAPVTILISIDGARPDYLDRGLTPVLSALAADGVRAPMRPSFPTKTYPNHYVLVTGLVPDHNGIVANKMRDAARPDFLFTMQDSADEFWWDQAEPVWAAAERAGIPTASVFWPGANAGYQGVHPRDWWLFSDGNSERQRVDAALDWLRRPDPAERPRFILLYFDKVDHEGHKHGVDSPELAQALRNTDAAIGRLTAGLGALGQPANLVVVSDHGMAMTPRDHVVMMDALADPADWVATDDGPYIGVDPKPGREAALAAALRRPHDHVRCWPRGEIPARLRYGGNPRVPAWVCLADVGWLIWTKVPKAPDVASHGYDNQAPEMRAIFVANGPAFRAGRTLPLFDNVDIEPLLRDLIGLPPHAVDGSDAPFRGVLRR
ncbi:ectonucleotide pyrophosphatase/phosphodiesterase [Sphingomonas bacterium]|uniref:alkaline phosphatase family protein n=1 Tax=Sphingomonas bacterium TaxID=1895847 RepID=UPI0015774CAA|nr:ectonucleotide pyrophosphatase/phosphodiesterase [Sphingomonas bacterium]